MTRPLSYLAVLCLFFSSCKVGQDYVAPEVEIPDGYIHTDESSDSLGMIKWWELFNDPVLDSTIVRALDHNQNILIARENIEQAQLRLNIRKANLYPMINGQVSASSGNYRGVPLPENTGNYVAVGNLNWEIDLWGKLRRLNEAGLAEYYATDYGYRSIRLFIASQVASTYIQLREFQAAANVARNTLASRDSSLQLVESQFNSGLAGQIDLNQAQILRAIAARSIPAFERLELITQNALSVLTGSPPITIEDGESLYELDVVPNIPIGLPSELLRSRPDLLAAEQRMIAQNAYVGVAIANRFPSFRLTGALGLASPELTSFVSDGAAYNVGGDLFGPIFNWGQNKRRVEIEESRLRQEYLSYQNQLNIAFQEVEDALISIDKYKIELEAVQDHVKAATSAEVVSADRYATGLTTYLEYLESQRQSFDARLELVRTRSSLLNSYIQLYSALGGGWLTEDQK